jgi:alpha-1,2-mannosyltransferase
VDNQSLNGALTRLTGSLGAAHPYWVGASVVIGLGGLLLAARASRQGREMLGILTCALTGLLISPISWAHHWVWIAPALVVAADMAVRAVAPGTGRLLSRGRSSLWRLAAWVGVVAIAVPFFLLPSYLVPRGTIRDISLHPAPLLTGNLYVISGLVLLGLSGLIVLRPPRAEAARPQRDEHTGIEDASPGHPHTAPRKREPGPV